MSIAKRLYVGFLAVLLLTLGVGGLCLSRMRQLNEATRRAAVDRYHKVELAQRGVELINRNGRRALQLFLVKDPERFQRLMVEQERTAVAVRALYPQFEKELDSDEERRLLQTIYEVRARYLGRRALAEGVLKLGNRAEAEIEYERDVLPDLNAYIEAWDALLAEEGRRMNDAASDAARTYARTRTLTIVLIVVAAAIGIAVAFVVTRRVSKPLLQIAHAAERLERGDLAARVDFSTKDEVGVLARAFNLMGEAVAFRQERLQREMNLAQQVQTSLLPRNFRVPGLQVAAAMKPATEVGGDYYDVLPVEDGCWLGMGDVSGHGLNAGLVMLMLQSSVATLVSKHPEIAPRSLVSSVNAVLHANLQQRLGVQDHATMVMLRFHADGNVVFAGAHEQILVWRNRSGRCESIETTGTWVGSIADIEDATQDSSLTLEKGDIVILFTDGMIEAQDAHGVMFGSERLAAELERAHAAPVEDIRDAMLAAVAAWAARVDDDQSILVARYEGPPIARAVEPVGVLEQDRSAMPHS